MRVLDPILEYLLDEAARSHLAEHERAHEAGRCVVIGVDKRDFLGGLVESAARKYGFRCREVPPTGTGHELCTMVLSPSAAAELLTIIGGAANARDIPAGVASLKAEGQPGHFKLMVILEEKVLVSSVCRILEAAGDA